MARGLAKKTDDRSRMGAHARAGVACGGARPFGSSTASARRLLCRAALLALACACAAAMLGGTALGARVPRALAGASSRGPSTLLPRRPTKVKSPTLSGLAEDGQILTAQNGTWRGTTPMSFSYQWEVCSERVCTAIPGATEASYRVDTADIGHFLRILVTARNSAGQNTAHSKDTRRVVEGPPVSSVRPLITGTPVVGQTLEAGTGEWYGTPPFTYQYQWLSCNALGECVEIPGATGAGYMVQPLYTASAIEVVVSAANKAGSASATSQETSAVSEE